MTPAMTDALIEIEGKLIAYFNEHPEESMHETLLALQTIRTQLNVVPAVAAIYHEGIERLGSHVDVEA